MMTQVLESWTQLQSGCDPWLMMTLSLKWRLIKMRSCWALWF